MVRLAALVALILSFITVTGPVAYPEPAPPKLVVNSREVGSDVPPLIVDGRTLVPIRIVSENLGATVQWLADTRTVVIKSGPDEIKIRIGDPVALVRGEERRLDVPARIVKGRTMVPLRFVGEALGAEVRWDGASRTVTVVRNQILSVEWEKLEGSGRLTIKAAAPVDYSVKSLEKNAVSPDRLVVDITGAKIALASPVIPVGEGDVLQIRAGMLQQNPDVSRIVVDLREPVRYSVETNERGNELYLNIKYKVTNVWYDPRTGSVVVSTSGPVKYESFELVNPNRVVIDVLDTTLSSGPIERPITGAGALTGIRAGQFAVDPDKVRVVVDLSRPLQYKLEGGPGGVAARFTSELNVIEWSEGSGKTTVSIRTSLPVDFKAERLTDPARLLLRLPDTRSNLSQQTFDVNTAAVSKIGVSTPDSDPGATHVVLELPAYSGHRLYPSESGDSIVIEVVSSPLFGRRIAVDAGHGGSDPGAIGPAGTLEKEVNLDTAIRLKKLLSEAGAVPIMIRERDETVELYERPEIARRASAEVYVSIHSNSFTRDSKSGTETYHFPGRAPDAYLAEAVHRELIRALGTEDRGVRVANFVVLRDASIPAVLVELAFISNPGEEIFLRNPEFRQKAAEAIFRGLSRYFSNR